MGKLETINIEPQIKNPEKIINNIENKNIPEIKYENICENIWKNNEFVKQICKSFDIKLRDWLEEAWIDFQALLEKNNLTIENLA